MIKPYKKNKNIYIMIWSAIWIGGHSDVVIMVKDENVLKKEYSRFLYFNILEEAILLC